MVRTILLLDHEVSQLRARSLAKMTEVAHNRRSLKQTAQQSPRRRSRVQSQQAARLLLLVPQNKPLRHPSSRSLMSLLLLRRHMHTQNKDLLAVPKHRADSGVAALFLLCQFPVPGFLRLYHRVNSLPLNKRSPQ
jgi:hypothetical protein